MGRGGVRRGRERTVGGGGWGGLGEERQASSAVAAIRSRADHFIPHLAAAIHVPRALSPPPIFPSPRGALKCTFEKTFAILREKDCVKSEPPSL